MTGTATLEIVELADGEVVLRRSDSEDTILTIGFSDEATSFLGRSKIEVCKAMIGAGVECASQLKQDFVQKDGHADASNTKSPRRVLH